MLAERAIEILVQEGNVVEVSSPQFVVGDVHGQFYDFLKMLEEVSKSVLNQFRSRAPASSWETTWTGATTPSKPSATYSPSSA